MSDRPFVFVMSPWRTFAPPAREHNGFAVRRVASALWVRLSLLGAAAGFPRRHPARRRKTAMVRDLFGSYTFRGPQTEETILGLAEDILRERLERLGSLTSPESSAAFLRMRLGALEHEEFHAVWLDNRHRVLAVDALFRGTIDGASVHPREVVKAALRRNAAAVIFSHNHPSGSAEPSAADRAITVRLRVALELVDVRLLDHIVVSAEGSVSLASRGWC